VRACAADVPDLILMDLMMPVMDGAEATRIIMRQSPCAILVVTATVDGHASKVFDAMGWGALDAVNTPVLGMSGDPAGAAPLLAKIAMLRQLIGRTAAVVPARAHEAHALVAIGASTGGPGALACLLAAVPRTPSLTVAVVQHVDAHFAPGLASWLGGQTGHDVRTIGTGDRPEPGTVQLASTNDHLVLAPDGSYRYTAEPADYVYRPSVDVFFESVVQSWAGRAVGVLLTGIGADGARGLLAMRRAGWHTVAQDEATSVVYGMPRAAAALQAAVEILPVEHIAGAIIRAIGATPVPRQRSRRS
jgi:two-component system, chemotaxis family, response regulator WspF